MSLPQWCGTPETHHAHDGCWGWPTPAAPAVPVGVQPEPAEEMLDRVLWLHRAVRVGERGVECNCGDWFRTPDRHDGHRQRVLRDLGLPAVPVVHPEPGDRPMESAMVAARLAVLGQRHPIYEEELAAIVAAAVAAVRADTEAALALHTGLHQCLGGSWYSDNDPTYRGTVATHGPCPTAALIRGES